VYGAPCATTRYRRAAIVQRLRNRWNHMLGEDLENGGNEKGVSNGLVISAVLLKR
jgi:hypothetical protein